MGPKAGCFRAGSIPHGVVSDNKKARFRRASVLNVFRALVVTQHHDF